MGASERVQPIIINIQRVDEDRLFLFMARIIESGIAKVRHIPIKRRN